MREKSGNYSNEQILIIIIITWMKKIKSFQKRNYSFKIIDLIYWLKKLTIRVVYSFFLIW